MSIKHQIITLEQALGSLEGRITTSDVWKLLELNPLSVDREDRMRLRAVMHHLGWQHRLLRFNGERGRPRLPAWAGHANDLRFSVSDYQRDLLNRPRPAAGRDRAKRTRRQGPHPKACVRLARLRRFDPPFCDFRKASD